MTATAAAVGYPSKYYCLINGWGEGKVHAPVLLGHPAAVPRPGLADGAIPVHQRPPADQVLEYPALTGVFVPGGLVDPAGNTDWFFDVTVIPLLICWLVAVIATALAQRSRPWTRPWSPLAPGIILAARSTGTCCRWHSSPCPSHQGPRPADLAGVFLGLGIAAKFYPLLLLGPMFLLCWRAAHGVRSRGTWEARSSPGWPSTSCSCWQVFDGWSAFYTFSRELFGEDDPDRSGWR